MINLTFQSIIRTREFKRKKLIMSPPQTGIIGVATYAECVLLSGRNRWSIFSQKKRLGFALLSSECSVNIIKKIFILTIRIYSILTVKFVIVVKKGFDA